MRKWHAAIPVAAAYAFSAMVFPRLPASARLRSTLFLPFTPPEGGPISRVAAALLLPTVALGVWLLFTALSSVKAPRPPLPEWLLNETTDANAVSRFRPTYSTIAFAVTALVALMHVVLLGNLLGWPDWTYQLATALLGFGMAAAGNVIPRTRPNWIMGVRTKRTLADRATWLKTHRLLGALLIASGGLVVLVSLVAPTYALVVALGSLLVSLVASHQLGTRHGPQELLN